MRKRITPLRIIHEYPEPGVFRLNCGGNVHAWVDTVVSPTNFRPVSNHT